MTAPSLARRLARARRRVLAHRRLLAGLLTAAAVAAGLRSVAPAEPPSVALTVAGQDLPAGHTVSRADLTTVDVPPGAVPDGLVAAAAGAVLATPVRRGEPITDARLVGPSLTTAHPGLTALPVRLPDGAMAGLLHAGDRIDLYAVAAGGDAAAGPAGSLGSDSSAGATRVAAGVLVLAVPPSKDPAGSAAAGLSGRLVLIGAPEVEVARVAAASVRAFLTFAFVH